MAFTRLAGRKPLEDLGMTAVANVRKRERPGGRELAAIAARTRSSQRAQPKIGIWRALEMIAGRAFNRISELEKLVAELRGEPESTARATAKRKPVRMSLVGDITARRTQVLIEKLKAVDPDTPVRVTIDSKGGNLNAAYDLADQLGRHKSEIHCHALQDCSSAAVVVMLAGTKRTAEPHCSFVLHRPSLARRPDVLADERVEGMLDNSAHGMARLLASITGTDAERFRPMLATARGKRLDSATAVELGIIHSLTPKKRKAR